MDRRNGRLKQRANVGEHETHVQAQSSEIQGWVCGTLPSGRSHANFAERKQEFGKS